MRKYLIVLFCFLSFFIAAQDDSTTQGIQKEITSNKKIDKTTNIKEPDVEDASYSFLTQKEFWLAIILIFFFLGIILLEYHIIKHRNLENNNIIKILVSTIIIFAALFSIVAGFTDRQSAPAFTLLGTIGGYLFGRNDSKEKIND